eukprot:6928586-Karenia_brevis.AAC.1
MTRFATVFGRVQSELQGHGDGGAATSQQNGVAQGSQTTDAVQRLESVADKLSNAGNVGGGGPEVASLHEKVVSAEVHASKSSFEDMLSKSEAFTKLRSEMSSVQSDVAGVEKLSLIHISEPTRH